MQCRTEAFCRCLRFGEVAALIEAKELIQVCYDLIKADVLKDTVN